MGQKLKYFDLFGNNIYGLPCRNISLFQLHKSLFHVRLLERVFIKKTYDDTMINTLWNIRFPLKCSLFVIVKPYISEQECINLRRMVSMNVLPDAYLTLTVRRPSYSGLTRSISWLLMPWLLTSPGHQQPWYWIYRICRSFSYLRKDFKYLCQTNVEKWHKMQMYVYVPCKQFSM